VKTIKEVEKEFIEAFQNLPSVDAKYAYLFELAEDLPDMLPMLKSNVNLVNGCQSKLWFYLHEEAGQFNLSAESDSMVIKGIAALLVQLVRGRTAEDITKITLDFIDHRKIWKLASERNNGLVAMLDHLHQQAHEISDISSYQGKSKKCQN